MIWALRLLGFGKTLLSWGRSALRWIFSDWRHILIAAVSLFAAYQWLEAGKYERAHSKAVASLERANKTIADMTAASTKAKADHEAKVAAINAENERKAENAKRDYQVRLASNDTTLREWLRKTNRGASGRSDAAKTTAATSGIVEASGAPDIPENYALVPISDLELTAQAYATLEALQAWASGLTQE